MPPPPPPAAAAAVVTAAFAFCCYRHHLQSHASHVVLPRSDHFGAASWCKSIHLLVVYRYISYLQSIQGEYALPPTAESEDNVCCVCLERNVGWWRQAEPCRHWQCQSCAEKGGFHGTPGRCYICRKEVASWEHGFLPGDAQVQSR